MSWPGSVRSGSGCPGTAVAGRYGSGRTPTWLTCRCPRCPKQTGWLSRRRRQGSASAGQRSGDLSGGTAKGRRSAGETGLWGLGRDTKAMVKKDLQWRPLQACYTTWRPQRTQTGDRCDERKIKQAREREVEEQRKEAEGRSTSLTGPSMHADIAFCGSVIVLIKRTASV